MQATPIALSPNLRRKGVAIPSYLAARWQPELEAAGFEVAVDTAEYGPFVVDMAIVRFWLGGSGSEADVATAFARIEAIVFGSAGVKLGSPLEVRWKNNVLPALTIAGGDVTLHPHPFELPSGADAFVSYSRTLAAMGRLTGRRFHFHCDSRGVHDPFPAGSDDIHLFPNTSPTGESGLDETTHAFGRKIQSDGAPVKSRTRAAGRGVTLPGKYNQVVQVIGNNIFFLLPIIDYYHGKESDEIFDEAFALGWNHIRSASHAMSAESDSLSASGPEAYARASERWAVRYTDTLRSQRAKIVYKIQDLQQQLATLYRQQHELSEALRLIGKDSFLRAAIDHADGDYAAILALPDVESAEIIEDGLHVATRRIVVEHGGRRHDTGSFIIRLSGESGKVTVWARETAHPDGQPHPHLPKNGGPCFGNATSAILSASAEHRRADAVRYVIDWLKYGYTESSALRKIDEWPEAA